MFEWIELNWCLGDLPIDQVNIYGDSLLQTSSSFQEHRNYGCEDIEPKSYDVTRETN